MGCQLISGTRPPASTASAIAGSYVVVPAHEPVHHVETAAELELEAHHGLHALPHPAVRERPEPRVLGEGGGFGERGGSAGMGCVAGAEDSSSVAPAGASW